MMKSLLSSIVCIAVLCSSVRAQDAEALPAPPQVQLTHQGAEGLWFRMDRARLILADVRAYRELDTTLVPQLELRIRLADLEMEHLRGALAESEAAETKATETLETAERRAREAEEDRDGLFAGQPMVWALVGAVATALTAFLVSK